MKIDISLAYFIGVIHSDGYIYSFFHKKRNNTIIRVHLTVAKRSLPMALKFQRILLHSLNRNVCIWKQKGVNLYSIQTSVNKFGNLFLDWKRDIPKEIQKSPALFGSYLGGLIDGDGHIKIKRNTGDRIISQCVIKIADSRPLEIVKSLVEKYMKCGVHFEYDKRGKGVLTSFYVSNKNIEYVKKLVYPHIAIPHKTKTLKKYFEMKERARRDSNPNQWVSPQELARLPSQQLLTEAHYPIR